MAFSYRNLARSDAPAVKMLRRMRRAAERFTIPAPRIIFRPLLWLYLGVRGVGAFITRKFFAEPLFKAYCTSYGKRVTTDSFVHWVEGKGDIILGNDIHVDGRCSFKFAARYMDHPTLEVGDGTGIGNGCSFTIGKRITIGKGCRIATGVFMFDSPGHSLDPAGRVAGLPADENDVLPIRIEDNVWIGREAAILPGVTIGEGAVVATRAVVIADVPPHTLVAGNPARKIRSL